MSQPANRVPITKAADKPVADSYLVKLKEDADMDGHLAWIQEQSHKYAGTASKCQVEHQFKMIKGCSAYLSGSALDELAERSDVRSIHENCEAELEGAEETP